MEMEDILAFKKLIASIAGNDLKNISGSTLSEVVDNCVMTVVLKDGNQASKVSYVKANDYLINPETGTFYTVSGDNFDYWQVVSADTNQESCKCYNRSFDMRITQSCSIVAVYKGQETMLTVSLKDGNSSIIQAIVSNGELLTDESNNFYQATGDNFAYWSVLSPADGREFGRCYNRSFNLEITNDCIIIAVYNTDIQKFFTGIADPRYTRKKYTDANGDITDYVQVDFLVQFDTSDSNLTFADIVKNSGGDIKFGVILEMDYNYLYDPTAEKPNFATPITDNNLLKETIKSLNNGLTEGGHKSGWNATSNSQLAQYNYYYNLYDLTDKVSNLSNFGRYDYFFKFANTEVNRARVYNVYTYIMVDDNLNNIIVSQPCVCSIYATGITDYDLTTMSTTNS